MSTMKTIGPSPLIELVACCLDCRVRHHIQTMPGSPFMREMDEWENKHRGHRIEFNTPHRDVPRDLDDSVFERENIGPWWLDYKPNANIKIAYASSVAMTFTSVNSLASDTNLLAGASALAVNNLTNLYLDYLLAGLIKNGSSTPTVNKAINVYVYRAFDDTPTYPDTLAGTDAAKTITTANILSTLGKPVASMTIAATANQVNPFDAGAISGYFGGVCPQLWSVFVVQNTAQALASSGNTVSYSGAYVTSV